MRTPRRLRAAGSALAAFASVLAIGAPVALAGPPETPETVSPATAITATGATLHGVLNPSGPSEGGGYRFSYKQSPTECEPEGTFRPESPALALGKAKETVSVILSGLEPLREYTFCLVASNLSAEATSGAPVSFKTLGLPPAVDEESETVGSTSVQLEAQVNPNNQATGFVFEYATKATGEKLEGTIVKLADAEPLPAQLGDATASVPRIEGLTSGKTYFYRVVAENAQSEKEALPVKGVVHSFTTVPVPTTQAATVVTATTAMFHGHLTPLNAVDSEYSFDYRVGEEGCAGEGTTPLKDAGTGSGSLAVSSEATGLQPSATYSVCMASSNAFGSETDPTSPAVKFSTPPAPPKIDGESASAVTPFAATLEAQLNANNETTTYLFEYADEETKLGTAGATVLHGEGPIGGYGDQAPAINTGVVLAPGTIYFYRLVAESEQSKAEGHPVQGAAQSFTTGPAERPSIEPGSEHANPIGSRTATFEANVNPDYQETTVVFEYAASEALLLAGEGMKVPAANSLPPGGEQQNINELADGLTPGKAYFFRVAATNSTGTTHGPVATFSTLPVPLVDETEPGATEVTQHTALIGHITVNPQIEAPAEEATYYILYGTTETYDHATPAPTHPGAGYGLTGKAVPPITLTDLAAGTTYHYAVVAHNPNGTETSHDHQFTTPGIPPLTTPPTIGAATPQFVNETSAIVQGEVNPEGQATTYQIQYGPTTNYGTTTPPAELPPNTTAQGTITPITELQPATTYHYRLTASNYAGTTNGPDHTVTTTGTPTSTFTPFPDSPIPQPAITPTTTAQAPSTRPAPKPLTTKQKLAAALRACAKKHNRRTRAACEHQAHRKYRSPKSSKA